MVASAPHPAGRAQSGAGGEAQHRSVQRVLALALATNLSLSFVKLSLGLLSGSLAVLADAMHSAGDGLASLIGLLLHGLTDPRPDRDHPYGHHKYEAVGALAIGALILFACFEILRTALQRLWSGSLPLRLGPGQLMLLLVLLGCSLLLALAEHRIGRRLNSALLLGDVRHSRGVIVTSLGVLMGLTAAVLLRSPWLDLALAVPLCLQLIRSCWRTLAGHLSWLVDRIAIAPEAIHAVALAVPGVLNCHDIASRGVLGQTVFIDMHLVVDADDLPTAHRITETVEEQLEARFGPVRCTIHLEPRDYASAAITFRGTHG